MAVKDFLFELGTEELPPKALKTLSAALEAEFMSGLKALLGNEAGSLLDSAIVQSYAAPRRLALSIQALATEVPASSMLVQGPPAKIAYDKEGKPSKALEGFARKCGTTVEQLEEVEGKICFRQEKPASPIAPQLPSLISQALDKLPIPKRMRWGASRAEFVRPVKWVLMMFGDEVIDCEILGLTSGRTTRGHRFHYNHNIELIAPSEYLSVLKETGYVLADFAERRALIKEQLLAEAEKVGGQVVINEGLLDEVTALNEWPTALTGRFEERFLDVPAEALISTMADNQKYFHLLDNEKKLMPFFITVANIVSKDPQQVISGNEKVIRPRLSDAAFFFETDKKRTLESHLPSLGKIVFQKELGTVLEKAERISRLAAIIAKQLGGNADWAARAGLLCKTDLSSEMVLEFPELQGLMGYHYALNDGEPADVAAAQNEHYMPRFSGDQLPVTTTGTAVAIADRLDTLVGLFGIKQPPTGSKDPFALRRAALGVLRIIVEGKLDLDLQALLTEAYANHQNLKAGEETVTQVFDFMLERFRAWYEDQNIPAEVYLAVQALKPSRPSDFDQRVQAVSAFRQLEEATALSAANKRVSNILSKQEGEISQQVDPALLQVDAEKALAAQVASLSEELAPLFKEGNYSAALTRLATLRPTVDQFFDNVMVMADDDALRQNRIALLSQLQGLFLEIADVSLLSS